MKRIITISVFSLLLPLLVAGQKEVNMSELEKQKDGNIHFKSGPFTGKGVSYYLKRKKASEISYVEGRKHGSEINWYESGKKQKETIWENGTYTLNHEWYESGQMKVKRDYKQSIWTEWYENGQKMKIFHPYKGAWAMWAENGQQTLKGQFAKGGKDGLWTYWNAKGQKTKEESYKAGAKDGSWTLWNEKGNKIMQRSYAANLKDGTFIRWWSNGNKRWEKNYLKNKLEGSCIYWSEDGVKLKEFLYENGQTSEIYTQDSLCIVTGTVKHTSSYCGGAAPPDELLERLRRGTPAANTSMYFRKGKVNTLDEPVFREVKTDEDGFFITCLPPGDYCLIGSSKLDKIQLENYQKTIKKENPLGGKIAQSEGTMAGSAACYEQWWSSCKAAITVGEKPVAHLQIKYHSRCFVGLDPCASYNGPYPP